MPNTKETPEEIAQKLLNGMFTGHAELYRDEVLAAIRFAVNQERRGWQPREAAGVSDVGAEKLISELIEWRDNVDNDEIAELLDCAAVTIEFLRLEAENNTAGRWQPEPPQE